jgi:hypothetical protein
MRFIIVLLVTCFLSYVGFAADNELGKVKVSADRLNKALMQKDSATLKTLLHGELTYGHSNGWIESKKEVIEDLFNGKLVYAKIEQEDPKMVMDGNTVSLRTNANIEVALDGSPVKLRLSVLQVWIKKGKQWQLLSRQSVKL